MSDALDEVLRAFEGLVREHEVETADSPAEDTNFRCVDCSECSSCRFCTACERCVDCTYCDACTDCEGCTQCRECLACSACSHTSHTAYCEKSSYLTLCLDCEGCVQCFACVGLTNEEFCILNQKYTRRAYFAKVNELRAALDARTLEGWFPPWMREEAASPKSEGGDPPTVHPEPLTDIAAAERTGSWPPIDHASARALDRGGRSPWDALDEDVREVEAFERDTVRRRSPEPQQAVREPDPHRRQESPAEAWMDAQRRAARERIERFEAEQDAVQQRPRPSSATETRVVAPRVVEPREEPRAVEPREEPRAVEPRVEPRAVESREEPPVAPREEPPVAPREGPRFVAPQPAAADPPAPEPKRTLTPPRVEDRPPTPTPAPSEDKPRAGSRFAAHEPAPSAGRWGEPRRDRFEGREAAPVSLLDEADSGIVFDKDFPRALIDELPRAARRRAPEPEAPRAVEVDPPLDPRREAEGDGRLTRGQRPTRPSDPPPNSLRSVRRPRRPDP